MQHQRVGPPPERERGRKKCGQSESQARWWPPGPEGISHPLKGGPDPLQSARSRTSQSVPTPRPAGQTIQSARAKKSSSKKTYGGIQQNHVSNVPLGAMERPATAHQARTGAFENAAGKSSHALSQIRLTSPVDASAVHMIMGERQEGAGRVTVQGVKADAFQGAAGTKGERHHPADVPRREKRQNAQHHDNNFHRGITGANDIHGGVYDFKPTSQGEKARSVPRRRSQVRGLISQNNFSPPTRTPTAGDGFEGQYSQAYTGAAGVSAGHWADARYASTTAWH